MHTSGTRLFVCLCVTLVVLVAAEEIDAKEEEIEASRAANIDDAEQAVKRMARAAAQEELKQADKDIKAAEERKKKLQEAIDNAETTKDTIDFAIELLNDCHERNFDKKKKGSRALDCEKCTPTYDECFKVDEAVTKLMAEKRYCQVFDKQTSFKNCVKKNKKCYDETLSGDKRDKYGKIQAIACKTGRNAIYYNIWAQLSNGCLKGLSECGTLWSDTLLNVTSKMGNARDDDTRKEEEAKVQKMFEALNTTENDKLCRVMAFKTDWLDMPACLEKNGCTETDVKGLTCKISPSEMDNGNTSKHGNMSGVLVWLTCMMTCLFVIGG